MQILHCQIARLFNRLDLFRHLLNFCTCQFDFAMNQSMQITSLLRDLISYKMKVTYSETDYWSFLTNYCWNWISFLILPLLPIPWITVYLHLIVVWMVLGAKNKPQSISKVLLYQFIIYKWTFCFSLTLWEGTFDCAKETSDKCSR